MVMPTYNKGHFIQDSIESVLAQTYKHWELLIVDDGSTDNTQGILETYTDRRIKVFKNSENKGAAYSRTFALEKAEGRYIAFLDSDDLWRPEKLAMQVAFMQHNGYGFTYHEYEEIVEDGSPRNIKVSGKKRVSFSDLCCCCWPGCLTVMYDAAIVDPIKVEGLDRNNDTAMWLHIARKADCHLLKQNLASYRQMGRASIMKRIGDAYRLFRTEMQFCRAKSAALTMASMGGFAVKKIFYTCYGYKSSHCGL